MSYGKIDIHDFYCLNCGNKAGSCVRPQAHRREKFHRKKLYCPHCQLTLNCVETKSDIEAYEFKEEFLTGAFAEEAKLSIEECVNYYG
jgi:hypothetical protein